MNDEQCEAIRQQLLTAKPWPEQSTRKFAIRNRSTHQLAIPLPQRQSTKQFAIIKETLAIYPVSSRMAIKANNIKI